MKSNVKKIILSRVRCPNLKRKIAQSHDLSKDDKYLLIDTLGINDKMRQKYSDVEEYYQELCYNVEGVK